MSVINRMLTDLERRRAPGASRQRRADGPAPADSPRRWVRRLAAIAPAAILVALMTVAAALWWQQWPRMQALIASAVEAPAARDSAAEDDPPAVETTVPTVRRFGFERDGATVRLVVAFDRPLGEAPGYDRSGDRLGLRLPARWDGDELPAPPTDQSVYGGAVVNERGDVATRIGMRVDPDARFDLDTDGDRLILTGRAPREPGRDDDSVALANLDTGSRPDDDATGANGTADSGADDATASSA
ncbi:MAG: hypothetical protein ACOCP9_06690, partial [Halofilum sp. (in: g-proteobacteria)]